MREITDIAELKMIELDILKAIHSFCVENSIKYFLWGGTLLGSIRHNGFIPWDDDIDIAMPRRDYTRFMNEFTSDRYTALSCEKNRDYPYAYGKVIDTKTLKKEPIRNKVEIGVDVDIFPIDDYKDFALDATNSKKRLALIEKNSYAYALHYKNNSLRNILKNLYCFSLRLGGNKFCKKINNIAQSGYSDSSDFMLYADANIKKPLVIGRELIASFELHKFEDFEFYVPTNYDGLLRLCYGDYMQLPPEEERITHHINSVYWK